MEITFTRNDHESNDEFIFRINCWLSQNPYINIQKMYEDSSTSFGLLVNRENLCNVTLIYEVGKTFRQYELRVVEKLSLMKLGLTNMKEDWLEANPGFKIVSSSYTCNARGKVGSLLLNNFGAMNRNRLVFICRPLTESEAGGAKTQAPIPPAQTATPLEASSQNQAKFCIYCGAALQAEGKFCVQCGKPVNS